MRKTKKVYIIYKAQRLLMSTDACMGGGGIDLALFADVEPI